MKQINGPEWNRVHYPAILGAHGYQTGVEVGVQAGEFSNLILAGWPGKLYMVDCWQEQDGAVYHDIANLPNERQEVYYQMARWVAAKYGARAEIIRAFSPGAADQFADGSLDFAYLDGNHSHEATLADLGAWWPKLRAGGLMGGHDYMEGESHNCTFGVISALQKFFPGDVPIYVAEEMWSSWYLFKEPA